MGTSQDPSGMCRLPLRDGRQDDPGWNPARGRGQVAEEAFLLSVLE